MESNNTSNFSNVTCDYDFEYNFMRFLLIGVCMSPICIFGISGNCLIIAVLTRKAMRSSSSWYLIVLSLTDITVMSCSMMLYVVELVYDYTLSFSLYAAWFKYVKVVYLVSHVSQNCSVYLTVAATVERFMSLWMPRQHGMLCKTSGTMAWVSIILIFIGGTFATKYFELNVGYFEECDGFGRYQLMPSALFANPVYAKYHTIWFSQAGFVFIPFLLLAILNGLIFIRHQINTRSPTSQSSNTVVQHRDTMQRVRDFKTRFFNELSRICHRRFHQRTSESSERNSLCANMSPKPNIGQSCKNNRQNKSGEKNPALRTSFLQCKVSSGNLFEETGPVDLSTTLNNPLATVPNAITAAIDRSKAVRRREKKAKNREATVVLFIVVLVFLVCNAPAFALTLVEHIDYDLLFRYPLLYSFSRNGINMLTVINSSANIVIYLAFGREFRKTLAQMCGCSGRSRSGPPRKYWLSRLFCCTQRRKNNPLQQHQQLQHFRAHNLQNHSSGNEHEYQCDTEQQQQQQLQQQNKCYNQMQQLSPIQQTEKIDGVRENVTKNQTKKYVSIPDGSPSPTIVYPVSPLETQFSNGSCSRGATGNPLSPVSRVTPMPFHDDQNLLAQNTLQSLTENTDSKIAEGQFHSTRDEYNCSKLNFKKDKQCLGIGNNGFESKFTNYNESVTDRGHTEVQPTNRMKVPELLTSPFYSPKTLTTTLNSSSGLTIDTKPSPSGYLELPKDDTCTSETPLTEDEMSFTMQCQENYFNVKRIPCSKSNDALDSFRPMEVTIYCDEDSQPNSLAPPQYY